MPSFLATCVAVTVADRIKILIVDDDQGMLESLVIALEDEFELVTARNGQEALDVIGSQPVDVVLLDLMMPILDGEGYLREHNVRHPHTRCCWSRPISTWRAARPTSAASTTCASRSC